MTHIHCILPDPLYGLYMASERVLHNLAYTQGIASTIKLYGHTESLDAENIRLSLGEAM